MELKKLTSNSRVLLAMLAVQLIVTGLQLLSRVVLTEGTFIYALVTYRHIVAASILAPFAFYKEGGVGKDLTITVFFWLSLVALTGISMPNGLFYYGLKDTTAAYATNFLNLVPIFTFIFSIILRIETLGIGTVAGKLKVAGALLCFGGALTIVLYTGKLFHLTNNHHRQPIKIMHKTNQNKTRGTIFLVASCVSYGAWFILQVKLVKVFPHKYWSTFFMCAIGSVQSGIIGMCLDRRPKSWALGWNLQLITIFYSGILSTAASFCLISWAIANKGPTYPSMFNPLALIFVTVAEAIFLGEEISAGSLIGMGMIVVGLYLFLWGKQKDAKESVDEDAAA